MTEQSSRTAADEGRASTTYGDVLPSLPPRRPRVRWLVCGLVAAALCLGAGGVAAQRGDDATGGTGSPEVTLRLPDSIAGLAFQPSSTAEGNPRMVTDLLPSTQLLADHVAGGYATADRILLVAAGVPVRPLTEVQRQQALDAAIARLGLDRSDLETFAEGGASFSCVAEMGNVGICFSIEADALLFAVVIEDGAPPAELAASARAAVVRRS